MVNMCHTQYVMVDVIFLEIKSFRYIILSGFHLCQTIFFVLSSEVVLENIVFRTIFKITLSIIEISELVLMITYW